MLSLLPAYLGRACCSRRRRSEASPPPVDPWIMRVMMGASAGTVSRGRLLWHRNKAGSECQAAISLAREVVVVNVGAESSSGGSWCRIWRCTVLVVVSVVMMEWEAAAVVSVVLPAYHPTWCLHRGCRPA